MSYDTNIYVGWYAEFDPCTDTVQVGMKSKLICPNNKKHSTKGNFCSSCGAKIISKDFPKYRQYSSPLHLINETDPVEIEHGTFGRATVEYVKKLNNYHVVFPEFLKTNKVIVMAPKYTEIHDINRSDSSVTQIDIENKPDLEWQENIIKVFSAKNLTLKFGLVLEIV